MLFKNSFYLFLAQGFSKLITIGYSLYLAKAFGVENFGLYTLALAYFSLLSVVSDFGISRYFVREIAKDRAQIPNLLVECLGLRLFLAALLYMVAMVVIFWTSPDSFRSMALALAILAIFPQTVSTMFDSFFVGIQKLIYSSIGLVFLNLVTAIVGLIMVSRFGLMGGIWALLLGQLAYGAVLWLFWRSQKIDIKFEFSLERVRAILKGSAIYGVLGIIGLASFKIDTVFVSVLRGDYETGLYGAAYKFLESVIFIPGAVGVALFPILSKMHITEPKLILKLLPKVMGVMFLVGFGVSVFYILALPMLILNFLPKYVGAIDSIRILALAIPFIFMHVIAGQVILSTDRYLKELVRIYLVLFGINLVMYLMFISRWGYIGASVATVISEINTFLTFIWLIRYRLFRV